MELLLAILTGRAFEKHNFEYFRPLEGTKRLALPMGDVECEGRASPIAGNCWQCNLPETPGHRYLYARGVRSRGDVNEGGNCGKRVEVNKSNGNEGRSQLLYVGLVRAGAG